jgi:transposase
MLSSGNLNDGKAAIPLLKGLEWQHPNFQYRYATMDAGYAHEPIYQQVRQVGAHAIIAYKRRREPEYIGFDEHFAPTCVREYAYHYDSYDPNYETLKYIRPKACETCPLRNDSLCQKVYKLKITSDLRKYTAPARGSVYWSNIAKRRSAVERVNTYLKGYFQLNHIRHRSGQKAKAHLNLVSLVYNATKLAVDRINRQLQQLAA